MVDTRARERARTRSDGSNERQAHVQEQLRQGKRPQQLEPEDQAILLEARLSEGALTRDDLEFAADAGHAGAAWVLEREPGREGAWSEAAAGRRRRVVIWTQARLVARVLRPSIHDVRADEDDRDDDTGEVHLAPLLEALESWALGDEDVAVGEAAGRAMDRLEGLVQDMDETGALAVWGRHEGAAWQLLQTLLADDVGSEDDRTAVFSELDFARELKETVPRLLWRRVTPKPRQGAQPYSPKRRFAQGETITHPKFGEGTVTRALARQIEVAFADGTKKLAHNL